MDNVTGAAQAAIGGGLIEQVGKSGFGYGEIMFASRHQGLLLMAVSAEA
jgi:hypothetical protein